MMVKGKSMPGFGSEVGHQLGQEAAIECLKTFLDRVRERYKDQVSKLDGDWNENVLNFSLTTYGFTIDGVLTVEESVVTLAGKLPFAAIAFKGKIESSITAELEKALTA
ncbi:MAG TPA: hypothetical protein EYN70_10360 [Planctomycetaceae bacterium]|jgi:hypothetical protein|nr:hypothetical protein [Planctomycetaceae bacterium]